MAFNLGNDIFLLYKLIEVLIMDIYSKMRSINKYIMDKYNEASLKFYDYYMFQLSSYYLSLYRELTIYNNMELPSLSEIFVVRSMIECLAILKLYETGGIPEDSKYLLFGYRYLAEKKLYTKFDSLPQELIDKDKLIQYFDEAKDIYQDTLSSKGKKKKILNSKLPFLMEEISFDTLIEENLNDLLAPYKFFSVIIHPNDIITAYCEQEFLPDLFKEVVKIVNDLTVYYAQKYYADVKEELNTSFISEYNYLYKDNIVKNNLKSLSDCLYKISQYIHIDLNIPNDKVNLHEAFFNRLTSEIDSYITDVIFGYSEVAKSKVKVILELMASFYHIIDSDADTINLIQIFTTANLDKELGNLIDGNSIDKEIFNNVYIKYNEIMDTNLTLDEFFDRLLTKNLAVLLNKESINKFVYEMVDSLITDKNNGDIIKMNYLEAQLLSHGSGYTITANEGAFLDTDTIFIHMYKLIIKLIDKYYNTLIDHEKELNINLNNFKYDFNKLKKELESCSYSIMRAIRLKRIAGQKIT